MPARAKKAEKTAAPIDPVAASPAWPADSRVNEQGHLEVGGCDLVELASEVGTPAYVYAEQDMRDRAREYLEAFQRHGGETEILFASKSFPCLASYRLFREEGLSVDVASGGELSMALEAGFDPARIHMHGNNKSADELRLALESGVGYIVCDSADELRLIDGLAERPQDVLIRVTPGIDPDTHEYIATGGSGSKFGFDLATGEAAKALEVLGDCANLNLVGLHAHIGSQLFDLDSYESAIAALGEFSREHSLQPEIVNVGGGLAIAYLDEQSPPSVDAYAALKCAAVRKSFGDAPRIAVEPGRSLVGAAGVTIYRVGTTKQAGRKRIIAVDGGMSDNLRPMLYDARYQAVLADRPDAETSEEVTVVGKHCESGDVLIEAAPLAEVAPGDLLVVAATGAYGHAMANNYNGVPRPPVIFCSEGEARVVVRRETWQDLSERDV
jgi:diaminopimelate decarboxylase